MFHQDFPGRGKEVANFVTKSNLEDGVAFAIEKYVLN